MAFEGEYLNGKKWNGKHKIYNKNGKIIYECDYLNGEKNGIEKRFYENGNLKSAIEYLNGKQIK